MCLNILKSFQLNVNSIKVFAKISRTGCCQKFYENAHRSAERRVPGIIASGPGEHLGEGGKKESQCPSDDDVVIKIYVKSYQNDGVSDTCIKEKLIMDKIITLCRIFISSTTSYLDLAKVIRAQSRSQLSTSANLRNLRSEVRSGVNCKCVFNATTKNNFQFFCFTEKKVSENTAR